jgi:hypothetical protein
MPSTDHIEGGEVGDESPWALASEVRVRADPVGLPPTNTPPGGPGRQLVGCSRSSLSPGWS